MQPCGSLCAKGLLLHDAGRLDLPLQQRGQIQLTLPSVLGMLRLVKTISFLDQQTPYWSVTEITSYIRQSLESDYRLQDIWISGEVSNISRPASGHLYFTIKDSGASLRCVMWRSQAAQLARLPQTGERMQAHGHISVYEAGGTYQLYADTLRAAGEGEAFREFLRVKSLLEAEGLFEAERKRDLPVFPQRIGIVASPTSAGLQDVLHVLERRFPLATAILSPTPVQGEEAPAKIVSAIEALNSALAIDVILIVRGGGSAEDLRAFNAEDVVRAIAGSTAPTITGIGHETDLILADFAADRRAPTPSAAAEVAVPDRQALYVNIYEQRLALKTIFQEGLRGKRKMLEQCMARLRFASPRVRIANARQRVDDHLRQLGIVISHHIDLHRQEISTLSRTLNAIGPAKVLARGYALVLQKEDHTIIRSVHQVKTGSTILVNVSDGSFDAAVTGIDHALDEKAVYRTDSGLE